MRWRPASPSAHPSTTTRATAGGVELGASDDGDDTAAEVLGDDVLAAPCSPPMQPASVNAATTAARSGRAATARPGRAGVGRDHADEPSTADRADRSGTWIRRIAAGSTRSSREICRPSADREGMHERPGVRDDDRRPADREEVAPGRCDPCPQRSVRLTARPVDLEVASREGGSHVWRQRLQLVERPALGDPDVGLAPPLIELALLRVAAASTMADAVATARRDGLDTTRTSDGSSRLSDAASRRASARPVGDSGGSLDPAVADARPRRRCMPHEDDLGHRQATVLGSAGPATPALSKVAIPSRMATAASTSDMASAAPVPSPSRRSSSSSGRSPRRSRTTA